MASTNQGDNAVERLDNAVTAFEQIMTGPEGQVVQVPGHQPQPTLAERVKQNLKPSTDAAESDHLFLEWQYDKTPEAEQAWRDKVAEIKLRYPVSRGAEE